MRGKKELLKSFYFGRKVIELLFWMNKVFELAEKLIWNWKRKKIEKGDGRRSIAVIKFRLLEEKGTETRILIRIATTAFEA